MPLACLHLGADTGKTVECPSCAGTVRLKLHACERFAKCTLGKPVEGVACCVTCEDREPITPIRRVRIPLEGHHFNGSILRFGGKLLLATRHNWTRSRIWLHELASLDSPRVLWSAELDTGTIHGAEDPRLFEFENKLHVAFTAYNGRDTRMAVLRLGFDWATETLWFPHYLRAKSWEKNWSFFETGALHSVYSGKPWRVVRHWGANAVDVDETRFVLPYSGGEIRGGASPVRVGDEFYHWFHGFKRADGRTIYSVGVMTFDAATLLPRRVCRDPVMIAEHDGGGDKSVVYPCGAILDGDRWHVSYGFQDQDVRLAVLDVSDVERVLHDIQ